MPLCEQVSLWNSADLILTPNGAHFVNSPFMHGEPNGISRSSRLRSDPTQQLPLLEASHHSIAWHVLLSGASPCRLQRAACS